MPKQQISSVLAKVIPALEEVITALKAIESLLTREPLRCRVIELQGELHRSIENLRGLLKEEDS